MSASAPPNPPAPNGRGARNAYLRGLALGSIPLIVFWIFGGIAGYLQHTSPSPYNYPGATPFYLALILGVVGLAIVLIAAVVCLSARNTRPLGYGLLTMAFVGPVAAVGGCQIYLAALSSLPR